MYGSGPDGCGALSVTRRHLLVAAAATALSGVVKPGQAADVWHIYCDQSFPPFVFMEDGRLQGMDVEIVKAALEAAGGIAAQFHPVPWARALASLSEGVADLVFQLVGTAERFERYHMVGPLRTGETVLVARSDSPIEAPSLARGSLEDLAGLTIGTTQGFSYTPEFDDATHFVKDPAARAELSLRKLVAGRLDLVVGDRSALAWLAHHHELVNQIRFLSTPVAVSPRYAALPLDRTEKAERFAVGLRRIQEEGTLKRIIERWQR